MSRKTPPVAGPPAKRTPPEGMFKSAWGEKLTEAEVAFGKAMDAYKRNQRRPFPSCHEVLKVLTDVCGYRLMPYKPTAHYHIGAGVAWVTRSDAHQCPATLSKVIFDALEGGSMPDDYEGFKTIIGMRVYATSYEAEAARKAAVLKIMGVR